MTEEHPFNNTNFYGATKVAGEQMARAFYHRYKMPYVGLRYMNVYGPRQDYRGAYIAVMMKILDQLNGSNRKLIGTSKDQLSIRQEIPSNLMFILLQELSVMLMSIQQISLSMMHNSLIMRKITMDL